MIAERSFALFGFAVDDAGEQRGGAFFVGAIVADGAEELLGKC